jgi:ankyrin repeat protein
MKPLKRSIIDECLIDLDRISYFVKNIVEFSQNNENVYARRYIDQLHKFMQKIYVKLHWLDIDFCDKHEYLFEDPVDFNDAVIQNDKFRVRMFLNDGADPNRIEDAFKITPLHYAARYNSLSVAQLLVASGANINNKTMNGETPLDYAKKHPKANKRMILFLQNLLK